MRGKIGLDTLRSLIPRPQNPATCWDLVFTLWPLSGWLIKEEYLHMASQFSAVPESIRKFIEEEKWKKPLNWGLGCAHVLFATNPSLLQSVPYLREAFALPLIWKKGQSHDRGLPEELQRLADRILDQISPTEPWGLAWNFEEPCDLTDPLFSCKSAWASLAASLYLALEGARPDDRIWASAAWDQHRGIATVEGLEAKMGVIYERQGKILFLPERNLPRAKKINSHLAEKFESTSPLVLKPLSSDQTTPQKVLYPLLSQLDYPPPEDRNLKERIDYYVRQAKWDRVKAKEYYLNTLLDELAENCRHRGIIGMEPEELDKIDCLITYLSLNPEGTLFVLTTVQPKRILIFHTPESAEYLEDIKSKIPPDQCTVEPVLYKRKNDLDQDREIRRQISEFLNQHNPQSTAFDLTPGPKDFTIVASAELDPTISPFLYLGHNWTPEIYFPRPGHEQIRRLLGAPLPQD